jgi:hypothetical protein
MALCPLRSFFPTADELLRQDLPPLGGILLTHLNSYEDRVKQQGRLNRGYFRAMLENRNVGLGPLPPEPEYGSRQPEVTKRMMEAWNWLEREGLLIHNEVPGDWFNISTDGEKLLLRFARHEKWERLGLERVKNALTQNQWYPQIADSEEMRDAAWEWVRMKENKPPVKRNADGDWVLISEGRLDDLRALQLSDFDFKKLIRLCEELNIASREDCHFATGMLTRAVLDHVPPVFGVKSFSEVANNYVGGSKSFRETMLHLDTAAKKIADGLLHTQIRKSETLPNAQQVNFAAPLDLLLSEIIRINK